MIKKNDDIKLNITSFSSDGNGVGRYENLVIFVPETCIGDEIVAHIVKVKKTYAFAIVKEVIKAGESRIEADCPVSKACGGCVFRHMNYEAELEAKKGFVNSAFERIAKIDLRAGEILSDTPERYRNKAQYPLRKENDEIKAGFFASRSHRVIECEDCKLQPEIFSRIKNSVVAFAEKNNISVYDELSHTGLLRHIFLRQSKGGEQIALCLVINGDTLPESEKFANDITSQFKNIKSISLNINKNKSNVILGDKFINLFGDGYIEDELLGKRFKINAPSFYQVNREMCSKLYSKAAEYADLKEGETLIDLYCGIGTVGLCIANESNKLIGVEVVSEAIEIANENARINSFNNAEFICADASSATEILKSKNVKADCVIVDPPRKGCDETTIKNIVSFNPSRVVYISCNPSTLARDLVLFETLGFKAEKATATDMFPRTAHVETVCLLCKQ